MIDGVGIRIVRIKTLGNNPSSGLDHAATEVESVTVRFANVNLASSSVIVMPRLLVFESVSEFQLTGEPALTALSGRSTTTSRSVGFPSWSTS